jgi:hypothetical protein
MLLAILPDVGCLLVQPTELFMCFTSPARLQVTCHVVGIKNGEAAVVGGKRPAATCADQKGDDNNTAKARELDGRHKIEDQIKGKGILLPPTPCGFS